MKKFILKDTSKKHENQLAYLAQLSNSLSSEVFFIFTMSVKPLSGTDKKPIDEFVIYVYEASGN
jgi:hypothetical protein